MAQLQGGSKLFRSRRCIMFHSSLIVEEKKKIKRDLVKGGGQAVVVVRRCRRTRLGRRRRGGEERGGSGETWLAVHATKSYFHQFTEVEINMTVAYLFQ